MKPENTYIAGVHRHIPKTLYRMKNHNAYISGIPDTWYSGISQDLWVEYKYVPITTPAEIILPENYGLSKQQKRWYKERFLEGRNVWVIIGFKSGGAIFRTLNEVELGLQRPPLLDQKTIGRIITDFVSDEGAKHAQEVP